MSRCKLYVKDVPWPTNTSAQHFTDYLNELFQLHQCILSYSFPGVRQGIEPENSRFSQQVVGKIYTLGRKKKGLSPQGELNLVLSTCVSKTS